MQSGSESILAVLRDEESVYRHVESWYPQRQAIGEPEKGEIEAVLTELYEIAHLPKPKFIWCESPYQLVILPMFMRAVARGGARWRDLFASRLKVPIWQRAWARLTQQATAIGLEVNAGPGLELGDPFHLDGVNFWNQFLVELDTRIRRVLDTDEYVRLSDLIPGYDGPSCFTRPQPWANQVGAHLTSMCPSARIESMRWGVFGDWYCLPDELADQMGRDNFLELGELLATEKLHQFLKVDESFYRVGTALVDACRTVNWAVPEDLWLPYYSFVLEKQPDRFAALLTRPILDNWRRLMILQMPFALYGRFCFICNEPVSKSEDSANRLHNENGPAVEFSDEMKLYSWHGTTVDAWVIEKPQDIDVSKIEKEDNVEVRRVLIQRYGEGNFIRDSQAIVIHEDEFGVLYRKEFPDEEPIVMVRVKNSTPESDGTFKHYYLRVPPDTRTAREAVAWTFALEGQDYSPVQET